MLLVFRHLAVLQRLGVLGGNGEHLVVVEVAREESHCADLVGSRLESDVLQVAWESSRKASFARLHEEAFALLSLFCLFSEMERGSGIMGKMPRFIPNTKTSSMVRKMPERS